MRGSAYLSQPLLLVSDLGKNRRMSEHKLQNEIRNALAGSGLIFRANVGSGWTGDVSRLPDGSIIIRNPRPFTTGLPAGFSDLFGLVPVEITEDMVGQRVGIFTAMEVKTPTGRVSPQQKSFLSAIQKQGGRSGVTRSIADALRVMRGEDLQKEI